MHTPQIIVRFLLFAILVFAPLSAADPKSVKSRSKSTTEITQSALHDAVEQYQNAILAVSDCKKCSTHSDSDLRRLQEIELAQIAVIKACFDDATSEMLFLETTYKEVTPLPRHIITFFNTYREAKALLITDPELPYAKTPVRVGAPKDD